MEYSPEKRRKYYEDRKDKKPLINIYESMIQRCYNEKNLNYKHYGKRGIKVCDYWLESYDNFEKDMGKRLTGLTLDRIDVNGDYCLENCRWVDMTAQLKNRRPFSDTGHKYIYSKKRKGRDYYRIKIVHLNIDTTRTTLEAAILLVNNLTMGEI